MDNRLLQIDQLKGKHAIDLLLRPPCIRSIRCTLVLHCLSLLVYARLQQISQLSLVIELQGMTNALLNNLKLFLLRELVKIGRQVYYLLRRLLTRILLLLGLLIVLNWVHWVVYRLLGLLLLLDLVDRVYRSVVRLRVSGWDICTPYSQLILLLL